MRPPRLRTDPMRAIAYARILGLAIGLPLAGAFVIDGGVPATQADANQGTPGITVGSGQGLKASPAEVLALPRAGTGTSTSRGTLNVRNTTRGPLKVSFSAAASGASSKLYEIRAELDGRRIFSGTPAQLRLRGTRDFRLPAGQARRIGLTARLHKGARAEAAPRSFELEWTTGPGRG